MLGVLKVIVPIQQICHLPDLKRKFKMLMLEKLIDKIITEIFSELTMELHSVKTLFTLIKVLLTEPLKKLKTTHHQVEVPVQEPNTTRADMQLTTPE